MENLKINVIRMVHDTIVDNSLKNEKQGENIETGKYFPMGESSWSSNLNVKMQCFI